MIKRQGSGAVRRSPCGSSRSASGSSPFPLHSPKIEKLEVVARGDVRRAKLYYLRGKVGKRARVAERRWGIEDEMVVAADEAEAVDAEVAITVAEAEVVESAEAEERASRPRRPAAGAGRGACSGWRGDGGGGIRAGARGEADASPDEAED